MQIIKAKFHFVGVGGIGMCGIAEILLGLGAQVSGSDIAMNSHIERLLPKGLRFFLGHDKNNVNGSDVVVYSTAVRLTNPEIAEAARLKIPLIQRAEALAELMRLKRGIAIAGTHGKTTTTSMVASVFLHAGLEPTIFVGGRLDQIQSTAKLGKGDWFIAEADESDGSFHKLSPELAVITNIDSDHLDHYGSFENLQKSFLDFSMRIPFYGCTVVCGDDPVIQKIFQNHPKPLITYGVSPSNDYVLKGNSSSYEVVHENQVIAQYTLQVPGLHNGLNSLGALILALKSGIQMEKCLKGLNQYAGVDRRFQFKGELSEIKFFDDYAHHPTEIKATLQGAREKFPDAKLVVLFQPHRYSRTESCWYEFTTAFTQADTVLVTDIYGASELERPGIHSKRLVEEMKHDQAIYIPRNHELIEKVSNQLKPGDVFLTFGAGDISKIGTQIFDKLSQKK